MRPKACQIKLGPVRDGAEPVEVKPKFKDMDEARKWYREHPEAAYRERLSIWEDMPQLST